MNLEEAISILNKIGYGYTDRWKETDEGNIEAEGMRLSGPQAIAKAEYWEPLLLNYPEKKENRVSFSTDEINTGVPELLDRINTLERKEIAAVNEIWRLLLSRSEAIAARDNARARLESAEAKCQLPSMDGTLTACACCGARGIPSRGSKPEHAADCPFAALGESDAKV